MRECLLVGHGKGSERKARDVQKEFPASRQHKTMDSILQQGLLKALFIGARVSTLMVFATFFGSSAISLRIKAGLTLALTVLLYPLYRGPSVSLGAAGGVEALMGEMAAGLIIGLTMNFVMEGAQFAGQVLGFQFGFSLETAIDPTTQADSTVLATFFNTLAILIFLRLNVHLWVLKGLAASFDYLPLGSVRVTQAGVLQLFQASRNMMIVGVQMATPLLVATLLVDVTLGFLSRSTPQMPVTFMAISIKNVIGLSLMAVLIAAWPGFLEARFREALEVSQQLLHLSH